MCIDAIESDSPDWESIEIKGYLNGIPITLLHKEAMLEGLHFETRQNEPFSLKPMMQRISGEYEHTRPDGSSDRFKIEVDLKKEESKDKDGPSTNNESENKAGDIDSRDRDSDQ
jgi:hypothetical protein